MFKGPNPSSQPRSLRSIAESNESKNFPSGTNDTASDGGIQSDPADALKSSKAAIRPTSAAEKNPFNNLRGGK